MRKHHAEHLDGTKGSWRPTLIAGKILGADGHPESFEEIVVFSCPRCGAQQGVGADGHLGEPVIINGVTDKPVSCYDKKRCGWKSEGPVTFDDHQSTAGREHYKRLHDEAHRELHNARERVITQAIHDHVLKNFDQIKKTEMEKILPAGLSAADHRAKYVEFMKQKANSQEIFRKSLDTFLNG
jgi:hypothetical protein